MEVEKRNRRWDLGNLRQMKRGGMKASDEERERDRDRERERRGRGRERERDEDD